MVIKLSHWEHHMGDGWHIQNTQIKLLVKMKNVFILQKLDGHFGQPSTYLPTFTTFVECLTILSMCISSAIAWWAIKTQKHTIKYLAAHLSQALSCRTEEGLLHLLERLDSINSGCRLLPHVLVLKLASWYIPQGDCRSFETKLNHISTLCYLPMSKLLPRKMSGMSK